MVSPNGQWNSYGWFPGKNIEDLPKYYPMDIKSGMVSYYLGLFFLPHLTNSLIGKGSEG
jgi:hypothetical protein